MLLQIRDPQPRQKPQLKAAVAPPALPAAQAAAPAPAAPAPAVAPVSVLQSALILWPSIQLLLGKKCAAWRGHDTDARGAYDQLIGDHPQDFRGYLAKGKFPKERGRRADADRMFDQANFYAPLSMQSFVADRAGESPALTQLPGNDME
eukprot:jgi/Chrzof1/3741/Cz13g07070.t1